MMLRRLILLFALLLSVNVQAAQFIPDSSISGNIPRKSELAPTGETNAVCIGNTPGVSPSVTLCSSLDLTGKSLLFKLPEYAVAALPGSHPLAIVTDGSTSSDCVKGGGAFRVLCAWNGSAWASIGGGTGGTGDVTDVLGTANEICITNGGGPQPQAGLCSTIITDGKTLRVGRFELTNTISPSITGNVDDWAPTGIASAVTVRVSGNAIWEIRGINAGAHGRVFTLYNVGSFAVILKDEASTSAASNRFGFGSDITLGPKQGILLQYDDTGTSRWRALSGPASSPPRYCADQGATDAYACNLPAVITTYTTGEHDFFKANTANTGQATLAFNGIPSPPVIKKQVGGVTTDLDNGDIRVGQIVEVVFDGTNWQMLSQLGNSPTGISGLTTGTVPKAASPTILQDSTYSEDTNNALVGKPIIQGNCATNCATHDFSAITGQKTITWPNHAGTVGIFPNARKVVQVELFDPATDVTSGNGKFYFRVPTSLNGMNLVAVNSNLVTAGTTGLNSVQITRCAAVATSPLCSGTTASMLSTVLSIDSGETSSSTAATAAVIDTSNDDIATGQILRLDVTTVSSSAAKGLIVNMEFELP